MSSSAPVTPELEGRMDEVLSRAAQDWIWAATVYDIARSSGARTPGDLTDRAVELMSALLREHLIEPGRIAFGQFVPWRCATDEAIDLVAAHWRSLPYRLGTLDFAVWFSATDRGLDRAERRVAAESGSAWTSPVRAARSGSTGRTSAAAADAD